MTKNEIKEQIKLTANQIKNLKTYTRDPINNPCAYEQSKLSTLQQQSRALQIAYAYVRGIPFKAIEGKKHSVHVQQYWPQSSAIFYAMRYIDGMFEMKEIAGYSSPVELKVENVYRSYTAWTKAE